jgi:hypothetical protein
MRSTRIWKNVLLLTAILVIGLQITVLYQSNAYSTGPDPIGTWAPANSLDAVMDVAVNGDLAYLAIDSFGIQILNISDPSNPQELDSYEQGGIINTITYADNKVYVGVGSAVMIYDVTDPNTIVFNRTIGQYSTVYGIAVVGIYIYIADYSGSFVIANITGGNHFSHGHGYWVENNYWCFDVVVDGNYAYTATSSKGLVVWDITNKFHPQILGEKSFSANVYAIGKIDSNTMLLGGYAGYLAKCSVASPSNPTLLGSVDTTGDISKGNGIAISGTYAILGDYSIGVTTVGISSNTPTENTRLMPTSRGYGIAVDSNYVYGALGFGGFAIWNRTAAISGISFDIPGFEYCFMLLALFMVILFLKLKPKEL